MDKAYPLSNERQAAFLPGDRHNYLSVASFQPSLDGTFQPRASTFAALHCVVLHDLRPHEWGGLEAFVRPTWVTRLEGELEEVGFVLSSPICDLTIARGVLSAASDAFPGHVRSYGACLRLPDGSAHGPPPALIQWNPSERSDARLLVGVLNVEVERKAEAKPEHEGARIAGLLAPATGVITRDDILRSLAVRWLPGERPEGAGPE